MPGTPGRWGTDMSHVLEGVTHRQILITTGAVHLPGDLATPSPASGAVIFAHGSGSSRLSPRNIQVARTLNQAGLATLLFDLLTPVEAADRANVFDIALLAARLGAASDGLRGQPEVRGLPVGYFGASTGAAAALLAAGEPGPRRPPPRRRPRAHAAHRRRGRPRGARSQPSRPAGAALRERAGGRSGSHASLRGARRSRTDCGPGARVRSE